eukprot:TRINITY_DN784_c4_g2_i1.p1 TRINITY_DN784_c4_g2~~TRINITY_DN784_c4_g2_i1.p1  ORF type:complete len:287 (-),score=116.26 TRINITY_DN784_c4_g2_i1:357-1217(-)
MSSSYTASFASSSSSALHSCFPSSSSSSSPSSFSSCSSFSSSSSSSSSSCSTLASSFSSSSSSSEMKRALHSFEKGTAALLLIDPQRAFTTGVWSRHFQSPCKPIKQAFDNCARLLASGVLESNKVPVICSRCPFPRDFDYDESVAKYVEKVPCFIKCDTNIMEADGFSDWLEKAMKTNGLKSLIIGGCTLTSCVRVSSTETQLAFADRGLQVIVDLSLSGAREENYQISGGESASSSSASSHLYELYGSLIKTKSPVDLSLLYMKAHGVKVAESINWKERTATLI